MTNYAVNIHACASEHQMPGASFSTGESSPHFLHLAMGLHQALEHIQAHAEQNGYLELSAPADERGDIFSSLYLEEENASEEEESLAGAAPSDSSVDGSTLPTASYASLEMALALVAGAVSQMTSVVGTTSASISSMNAQMGEGMESVYQALQTQAANNLESQENESGWDKFWNKVGESLGVIISVCFIAGGLITGNWEVSLAVGTLLILKETGALSDIATGVSDLCRKIDPNMNPKTAQVIGDIVADVVGAVACMAAGRIGAGLEEGVEATLGATEKGAKGTEKVIQDDVSEEGQEADTQGLSSSSESIVEESSHTVEQMTTENVEMEKPEKKLLETVKEIASRAGSAIKTINPFSYTPKFVNELAFGFAQSWTATQTSSAIVQTMDFSNSTTQKWVEGMVGGLTVLTDLFVSGASLMGLGSEEGAKKCLKPDLFQVVEMTKLLAGGSMVVTELVQAGLSGWEGALTERNGVIQAELEETEYLLDTVARDNQMNIATSSKLITDNFTELLAVMNAPGEALSSLAQSMYQA